MNLLLTMMFSSNIIFVLYLAVNALSGDCLSERWKSRILKISILLSLIPLPAIKTAVEALMRRPFTKPDNFSFIISGQDQLFITAPNGIRLTPHLQAELIIFTIWFSVGFLRLCYHLFLYCLQRRAIATSMCKLTEPAVLGLLDDYKKNLDIRRPIQLYTCPPMAVPFTMGLFYPIIIIPDDMTLKKKSLVLHHELCHIKHYDNLFTFLRLLSVSLYWFNPLFHLLNHQIERVSELACDEVVIQQLSNTEKREYGYLIIETASTSETNCGNYAMALCRKSEHRGNLELKERMTHIMKKQRTTKRNRIISAVLAAFMVLCSSIPAFAYQSPKIYEFCEEDETPVYIDPNSTFSFFSEGSINPYILDEATILYDHQFTDSDGNIYDLEHNDNIEPRANCQHTYVSGKSTDHNKKSDGSCVLKTYSAKVCSKCGKLVKGSLLSTNSYNPCPH